MNIRKTMHRLGKRTMFAFLFVLFTFGTWWGVTAYGEGESPFEYEAKFLQPLGLKENSELTIEVNFIDVTRDFSGTLSVTIPDVDSNYYLYTRDFQLQKGTDHTVWVNVPVRYRTDRVLLHVQDRDGKELSQVFLYLDRSMDNAGSERPVYGLFVGRTPIFRAPTIELEQGTEELQIMPDFCLLEALGTRPLTMYDVICIGRSYYQRLSEQQQKMLYEWTHAGGILIVNNMGSLAMPEGFLPLFSDEEVPVASQNDYCRAVRLGDGAVVFQRREYYSGFLFIESNIYSMFQEALDTLKMPVGTQSQIKDMDSYWLKKNNDQLLSWKFSIPALRTYVFVLSLYVFVGLPGVYLFLKQIQKRYYMRGSIILLSAIFGVVIFVMGANSRINRNYITSFQVTEIADQWSVSKAYASVQTAYEEQQKLTMQNGYHAYPILKNGELSEEKWNKIGGSDYGFRLENKGEQEICFLGNQRVGTNYLQVTKTMKTEEVPKVSLYCGIIFYDNQTFAFVTADKAEQIAYEKTDMIGLNVNEGDFMDFLWDEELLGNWMTDQQRELYREYFYAHSQLFDEKGPLFVGFYQKKDVDWTEDDKDCITMEYGLVMRKLPEK